MLFNSTKFLFVFFPIVFLVFFVLGRIGLRTMASTWLFTVSLVFYGWDDPKFLIPLISASIVFNYLMGRAISSTHSKAVLGAGIAIDLGLLAYFKYANFLAENLASLGAPALHVALPIGISFFTFTQIAFLVDCYRDEASEYNPVHYGLFVSYFPHLIAGPILHHKEMMPQFARPETYTLNTAALVTGLCWFAAGLFKRSFSPTASSLSQARSSAPPITGRSPASAWRGRRRWPTRSSSISTFRATPTWQSDSR